MKRRILTALTAALMVATTTATAMAAETGVDAELADELAILDTVRDCETPSDNIAEEVIFSQMFFGELCEAPEQEQEQEQLTEEEMAEAIAEAILGGELRIDLSAYGLEESSLFRIMRKVRKEVPMAPTYEYQTDGITGAVSWVQVYTEDEPTDEPADEPADAADATDSETPAEELSEPEQKPQGIPMQIEAICWELGEAPFANSVVVTQFDKDGRFICSHTYEAAEMQLTGVEQVAPDCAYIRVFAVYRDSQGMLRPCGEACQFNERAEVYAVKG